MPAMRMIGVRARAKENLGGRLTSKQNRKRKRGVTTCVEGIDRMIGNQRFHLAMTCGPMKRRVTVSKT